MRPTMRIRPRAGTLAAAAAAVLALCGLAAAPATTQALVAAPAHGAAARPDYRRACAAPTRPRLAACLALVRTGVAPRSQRSLRAGQPPSGVGYGPASLQHAYVLPSGKAGGGQTVAIVDAFDDPKAAADLATYRSDWGPPPCTTANGASAR